MLDLGSGVAGGARGWVPGRAGLWGVPPTRVWVVGFSPQILEHPTSICDTGVHVVQITISIIIIIDWKCIQLILLFRSHKQGMHLLHIKQQQSHTYRKADSVT